MHQLVSSLTGIQATITALSLGLYLLGAGFGYALLRRILNERPLPTFFTVCTSHKGFSGVTA